MVGLGEDGLRGGREGGREGRREGRVRGGGMIDEGWPHGGREGGREGGQDTHHFQWLGIEEVVEDEDGLSLVRGSDQLPHGQGLLREGGREGGRER